MINQHIEDKAVSWYCETGTCPKYAFVHPSVHSAMKLELQMNMDKWDRKYGFSVMQMATSVGILELLPDSTIDGRDIVFVSDRKDYTYLDYLVERELLT